MSVGQVPEAIQTGLDTANINQREKVENSDRRFTIIVSLLMIAAGAYVISSPGSGQQNMWLGWMSCFGGILISIIYFGIDLVDHSREAAKNQAEILRFLKEIRQQHSGGQS
jgi:hypothetical protein